MITLRIYGAILLPSPIWGYTVDVFMWIFFLFLVLPKRILYLLMYSCGFSFFFRSCLREYFEDWISHSLTLTYFIDLFSLCRKLLKYYSPSARPRKTFLVLDTPVDRIFWAQIEG